MNEIMYSVMQEKARTSQLQNQKDIAGVVVQTLHQSTASPQLYVPTQKSRNIFTWTMQSQARLPF